jgi:hypothetical protein
MASSFRQRLDRFIIGMSVVWLLSMPILIITSMIAFKDFHPPGTTPWWIEWLAGVMNASALGLLGVLLYYLSAVLTFFLPPLLFVMLCIRFSME